MSQLSTFPSPASSKNNKPSKVSSGDDVCCAQACSLPSQPCCSHLQPCLGNTSALNQEWCPASAARKRLWCSVWCSLGFPVISHGPQANGTCTTSRYWLCRNQTLIWACWWRCHLATHFTCGDSQKSSRAKLRLAELSHFLTSADSTDKNSTLTFVNVQGYGVSSDLHLVQALSKATTDHDHPGAGVIHRREQGWSTEMLVDAPSATMVTLHHLLQVDNTLQ